MGGQVTQNPGSLQWDRHPRGGASQSLRARAVEVKRTSKLKFRYTADCTYQHSKTQTHTPRIILIYMRGRAQPRRRRQRSGMVPWRDPGPGTEACAASPHHLQTGAQRPSSGSTLTEPDLPRQAWALRAGLPANRASNDIPASSAGATGNTLQLFRGPEAPEDESLAFCLSRAPHH